MKTTTIEVVRIEAVVVTWMLKPKLMSMIVFIKLPWERELFR